MGKRANIKATAQNTETQLWQNQAKDLREQGLIPQGAGPREAKAYTEAASKHQNRFAVPWVLFGCLALSGFGIGGAGAAWFLLPIGAILGVCHAVSATNEAGMTDEERTRVIVRKQVAKTANWTGGTCTWCGAVVQHHDAKGLAQHPTGFHSDDIDVEVDRQMQQRFSR